MSEPTTHATSNLVYIFIDYSNVTHEGSRELNIANDSFNVDLNRLVITVRNGRELGRVFIAGSTPQTAPTPYKDELSWQRAKDLGFDVKTFQRNASNKEKGVDVYLACNMMEIILTKTPGILVLVTGDSDFSTPINKAKEKKWGVEIWSWPKGMAKDFKSLPHVSLKDHHKSFAYVTKAYSTKSKYALKIGGDIIKSWRWKNEPIMEYFFTRNLLCQFYWIDATTAHLYFDKKLQLKEASDWWLSKDHPNMFIEELGRDIKNDRMPRETQDKKFAEIVTELPQQTANEPLVDQLFNGGMIVSIKDQIFLVTSFLHPYWQFFTFDFFFFFCFVYFFIKSVRAGLFQSWILSSNRFHLTRLKIIRRNGRTSRPWYICLFCFYPCAASELVYIFIDYSNVTHEGSRELNIANDNFNVDLNRLVITVCNGRKLGGVYIAGSTPQTAPTPLKDELSWKRAEHHGFNVKTFPRNASNKEKKVDSRLTCDIMLTIRKNPGILVLVAGDSDYSVPLEEAQRENWEVEIWFWPKGKSKHFSNFPYTSLNFHYKSFVYITGSKTRGWLTKKYPMLLKEQGKASKSAKMPQNKKITEDITDLPKQNTSDPLDDQYVFVDLSEIDLRKSVRAKFSHPCKLQKLTKMASQKMPATSELVYVFIDHSNVINEGPRFRKLKLTTDFFNIDHNRLVITVCNGRRLGGVYIAGSHPPSEDELWERAKDLGFNFNIHPKKEKEKEKKVDAQLVCDMTEIILDKTPGILVLVSGDSDFTVPLYKAKEKNWRVEVWSWSRAMANDLMEFPYAYLDPHADSFVYITEPDSKRSKHSLEITGMSWRWKNEPIMECYRALNLLCQFCWLDDTTAHLYFDDESDLKKAEMWLSKSYPDLLVDSDPFLIVDLTKSIMLNK
ncbi:NYN domain-containing protein [Rhizophagus clarus]|uniref:NYN domain-containing protein n=1 Tax=Rhizophagus clarus TaxID=94130 RepID=A0A8H3MCH4_9GLOM|nr:NYN domain-containing protein [Rhizophagus clarus]